MLSRGSRTNIFRRKSPASILQAYDELWLPWLCPAISPLYDGWRASFSTNKTHSATQTTAPRALSKRKRTSRRQIATASEPAISGSLESFPPYANNVRGGLSSHSSDESFSHLRRFQPEDLIILPTPKSEPAQIFKTARYTGATGDMSQLQENISACFRVGSLDHGAKLIRSMMWYLNPSAPQVIEACHEYLGKLLESTYQGGEKQSLAKMQKWLELDMRARGVPLDSISLALVMKGCLLSLQGARLEKTLRHYLQYAQELGEAIQRETLSSALFSEDDVVKILRNVPQDDDALSAFIDDANGDEKDSSPAMNSSSRTEDPWIESGSPAAGEPPTLRAADQKGLGLKTLLTSLASMNAEKIPKAELAKREEDPLHARQMYLEQSVLGAALERWREESSLTQEMRQKGALRSPLLGSYVHEWVSSMVPLVEEEIKRSEEAQHQDVPYDHLDRILIGPFLKMMTPEKISAATILAFLNSIATAAPDGRRRFHDQRVLKLMIVVQKIGGFLEGEIRTANVGDAFLHKIGTMRSIQRHEMLASALKQTKEQSQPSELDSEAVTESDHKADTVLQPSQFRISTDLKIKLGALLFSIFMKVARLPVTALDQNTGRRVTSIQPVVSHSWFWQGGRKHGVVITNAALLNRMKHEPVASFIAKHLPMVVKPRGWRSLRDGAYLTHSTEAVRLNDQNNSQKQYLSIADRRGDLRQLYKGLDVIGKVPWRVNRALFDILAEAWNSGEPLGKLAPADPKAEYPPEPDQSDRQAHHRWMLIVKRIDDENTGYHSERCYQNFQLEVARSFLEYTFYCPHNMDFRGRAYPLPPYFNHMGADYVRCLFLFAEGKPLGETGLDWLKVHLSNCYGLDKESLRDRIKFVEEHLSEISDSVERPLQGRRWWLTGDSPWQTLAACIELKNALDSPEPSQFVSHLPVQQDGSCNGLQHYAALGGDEIGARQVNLAPGDKPADIYNAVADLVRKDVETDASKGSKSAQLLHGKLTRKVVKQPVMTNVYGVTHYGAVAQVKKQLQDILPKPTLENNINMEELARYVASLILKALSEMFNGAHAIQSWLGECGSRISQAVTPEQMQRVKERREKKVEVVQKRSQKDRKSKMLISAEKKVANLEDYQFKSTIVWTTPLGMPVVQPYRQSTMKAIKTNMQHLYYSKASLSNPVKKEKQLAAFPPNFIHSLDATHMMLSAIKCDEVGLTFAAVHDSFWTHAGDVPRMNRILRDAFVRMHSENIIGRLHEEFIARYAGCLRWAAIKLRSPLGRKIEQHLQSEGYRKRSYLRAAVSQKAQVDLLLKEYERHELLQSNDAEDNARGREMITPAALYEAESDAADIDIAEPIDTLGRQSTEARNMLVDDMQDEEETDEFGSAEAEPSGAPAHVEQSDESEQKPPKKKSKASESIHFWMPLTFPDPPERGSFDVSKLQGSQYFFS
ncbi:MAG: DNA-directed RNA polymerase [Chrysothrix sp. TS-e1954]|nr:MAG: DNA-directed RNA polymerase [Chrysothrix sp. TS-e1954]